MKKLEKGDIFYANLDPVVGSEQNGYRPVVIIQNNIGNIHSPTTIIAPITKQYLKSKKMPTQVSIKAFDKVRPNSIVLLEQIRTIDKSRLKDYIGKINNNDMEKINQAIIISLGLKLGGVQ